MKVSLLFLVVLLTACVVQPVKKAKLTVNEEFAKSDYPSGKHKKHSGFKTQILEEEPLEEESAKETPLYDEEGLASWYGPGFHGRKTANGETFNQNEMTAAHRKLPLGSFAQVTNLETGKTITVRINDRGPYSGKRIIDLSKAAAKELNIIGAGVGMVGVKKVDK